MFQSVRQVDTCSISDFYDFANRTIYRCKKRAFCWVYPAGLERAARNISAIRRPTGKMFGPRDLTEIRKSPGDTFGVRPHDVPVHDVAPVLAILRRHLMPAHLGNHTVFADLLSSKTPPSLVSQTVEIPAPLRLHIKRSSWNFPSRAYSEPRLIKARQGQKIDPNGKPTGIDLLDH